MRGCRSSCCVGFIFVSLVPQVASAQTGRSAVVSFSPFTYQGTLEDGGGPVTDTCEFEFSLWDSESGGTQLGSSMIFDGVEGPVVPVTDGVFTVVLEAGTLGLPTDGSLPALEIRVCCPAGSCTRELLEPRQFLTYAPVARTAVQLPAMSTSSRKTSANVLGGHDDNTMELGVAGATIGGGGASGSGNLVADNYSTVSGGLNNQAGSDNGVPTNAQFATVGGGEANLANSAHATVGGGGSNIASLTFATVAGGGSNTASSFAATVGGGANNKASDEWATVAGGQWNTASGVKSAVGGGSTNAATGERSAIGGGMLNTASGLVSTVGGGEDNVASGDYATIGGGGQLNVARPVCRLAGTACGTCAGGSNDGGFCSTDSSCPGGLCEPDDARCSPTSGNTCVILTDLFCRRGPDDGTACGKCVGGSNDGATCISFQQCSGGGDCQPDDTVCGSICLPSPRPCFHGFLRVQGSRTVPATTDFGLGTAFFPRNRAFGCWIDGKPIRAAVPGCAVL